VVGKNSRSRPKNGFSPESIALDAGFRTLHLNASDKCDD